MSLLVLPDVSLTVSREVSQKPRRGRYGRLIRWLLARPLTVINRRFLKTDHIKVFALDEADEMLSKGFAENMYDIFQLLPAETQVVLLSATMPNDVLDVTKKFMRDPIRILVKKEELTLEGIRQFCELRALKGLWLQIAWFAMVD